MTDCEVCGPGQCGISVSGRLDAALPPFISYTHSRTSACMEYFRQDEDVKDATFFTVTHDAFFELELSEYHAVRGLWPGESTFVPTDVAIHWKDRVPAWATLSAPCADGLKTILSLHRDWDHVGWTIGNLNHTERTVFWIVRDIAKIYESVVDVESLE